MKDGFTIEQIELRRALPKVFEGEAARSSEVWRRDLTLSRGSRVIIAAESGTGKSSLCAYIYGNRNDYAGEILFNGRDIRELTVDQWQALRRRHLAYLPQELSLFPELTALQNIELKNRLTDHLKPGRIREMLEMLGIQDRADFPVGKMSIGQQQRVGIIRALAQPFDFLLLDEPVSHLDETNNRIVARLVAEEASRQGAAVIATSVGNHLQIEGAEMLKL